MNQSASETPSSLSKVSKINNITVALITIKYENLKPKAQI